MRVEIQSGVTLTTFGEALLEEDGEIHLDGGKLDAQVVNIQGGILSGSGEVFVGTGPDLAVCGRQATASPTATRAPTSWPGNGTSAQAA